LKIDKQFEPFIIKNVISMINQEQFIKKSMSTITVGIHVGIFKEGKYFVVYCPALDLSSYGSDEEIAKRRFEEEVKIFFEETSKKGTLERYLLQLGWTLTKKPQPKYEPPLFNADQRQKNLHTFTERIAIPV
jgi:hypothetical protein